MQCTLLLPKTFSRVPLSRYRRLLLEGVAGEVDYRILEIELRRPLLSKYLRLPKLLRYARPGLCHLEQSFVPLLAFAPLSPCLISVHDMCPSFHPRLYGGDFIERLDACLATVGARRADAIVTVSHFQKDELARGLPFPPERIFVSPWAVDRDVFRPLPEAERLELRRRLGAAAASALVLSMSGWQPRKNVPAILRTVRMLLDRGRTSVS